MKIGRKYWICGFIAGEGYFGFGYRKLRNNAIYVQFGISLHVNDIAVLEEMRRELGGVVYKHEKRNAVHYRITRKKDLRNLIVFFERYSFPSHKYDQYRAWKAKVENSSFFD